MGKFAIECPNCSAINEKKWYQGNKMNCKSCGYELDFKKHRTVKIHSSMLTENESENEKE